VIFKRAYLFTILLNLFKNYVLTEVQELLVQPLSTNS